MRSIATLQSPDHGSIYFNDIDVLSQPLELRKVLGYLPQEFGVYPGESADRLLDYLAILKGIVDRKQRRNIINHVLDITNLSEVRSKKVSGYSGGMKQRFGIAQLLLNNPKLIIVDEPTAGLDPAERNRFLNILREIGTKSTVIFSTHIVDDIRDLCTDMAIMNNGKVLLHDSPQRATTSIINRVWEKDILQGELERAKNTFNFLSSNYNSDNTIRIRVYSAGCPATDFVTTNPDLEDLYFLKLNGY